MLQLPAHKLIQFALNSKVSFKLPLPNKHCNWFFENDILNIKYQMFFSFIHIIELIKKNGSGLFRRLAFGHRSFCRGSFCRAHFVVGHFVAGHFVAGLFRRGVISSMVMSSRTVKTCESHCWTSLIAGNRVYSKIRVSVCKIIGRGSFGYVSFGCWVIWSRGLLVKTSGFYFLTSLINGKDRFPNFQFDFQN
jgi:hypothetical protein